MKALILFIGGMAGGYFLLSAGLGFYVFIELLRLF